MARMMALLRLVLEAAPRTKLCQEGVNREYGIPTHVDGGWYRCCGGQVRKLVDCCSTSDKRINGDEACSKVLASRCLVD